VAARYRKARKKDKNTILNEFTQLTGYNRCYAAFLLRSKGKKLRINKSWTASVARDWDQS